ncbi:hypothetical protein K440DRAFT_642722 [Wilcoxina mikolae CBS 423.85]|nr:hypothetical protein K440DRAFT_642722 [Wilcoxina mikolae CBS 423.85]
MDTMGAVEVVRIIDGAVGVVGDMRVVIFSEVMGTVGTGKVIGEDMPDEVEVISEAAGDLLSIHSNIARASAVVTFAVIQLWSLLYSNVLSASRWMLCLVTDFLQSRFGSAYKNSPNIDVYVDKGIGLAVGIPERNKHLLSTHHHHGFSDLFHAVIEKYGDDTALGNTGGGKGGKALVLVGESGHI